MYIDSLSLFLGRPPPAVPDVTDPPPPPPTPFGLPLFAFFFLVFGVALSNIL